ncbi:MAG: LPS export ABC transporter ATP-binding protein [Gammaproteobacteria bacterium]|nr:LPS export ABC transporter ATP-binding protein [Gammaproteobacteria bacterium]MCP5318380.1 LPS export ABC transporter ATP-binding protein [Chromatiaceae bacterium]MCW5584889.1 LPS export ABC transporter ATP-binding protein [Chromatiales bacterium]MCB1816847.1 LPS export ABC transporter ATP-binding protein [Gammaproteobacteria bacterium]MCP5435778.1 LPS export ABC transporter ATP-binding protein [Chromatiaceae bacterium]
MTHLTVEDLVKRYRGRAVVNGVSLRLSQGEVIGLLGPNGAGKTTTFYMIAGLIPPDQGRVALAEHDLTDKPMHARARLGLGYLAQEPSIFRRLTVGQNVIAILETRADLNRAQRVRQCDKLLHEFGIRHLRDNMAISLSGGERRRLEIARALASEPKFILLDEPFAGVDPISVVDIQRIIAQLAQRGIGVLITDHNVRETLGICDRAYIINEGTVLALGAPNEILANPEVRAVYLGENFRL